MFEYQNHCCKATNFVEVSKKACLIIVAEVIKTIIVVEVIKTKIVRPFLISTHINIRAVATPRTNPTNIGF